MGERPTREELIELAKRDPEAIADLVLSLFDRLEKLEEEVAELKRNSRNSSKPPSSDNNRNKPPKSQRKRGGRKPGGQRGHQGHHLELVEDPDIVVTHELEGCCEGCGRDLREVEITGHERRQVHDLPEKISLEITEHQVKKGRCQCGKQHKASFPEGVQAPVQYGERLSALVVYLSSYQLIPCERLSEFCADVFDCPLSPGTVVNMVARAGARAGPVAEAIKEKLREAEFIHCDETGTKILGANQWLHVTSTAELAYFHIDPKRGFEALERIGILQDYTGWVIHDYYSSYYRFENCYHGLCNAHHLRDLTYIAEDLGQSWASEMKGLLLEAKRLKDRENAGGRVVGPKTLARLEERYEAILMEGYEINPEPERKKGQRGRLKRGKALNLLDRFWNRQDEVFGFLYFHLPFDNNEAERDLRMMKTRQKISGCFRNSTHAGVFTNLRSVITSAKKKAINVLRILSQTLKDPAEASRWLLTS